MLCSRSYLASPFDRNGCTEWLGIRSILCIPAAESKACTLHDPFHVVRVANRCLDTVRRRVQNELLGHRGRKDDPLYRIRKLLVSGAERLDERGSLRMLFGLRLGDPDDAVLGAWLAG
jgi:hypothetical protein